MGFFSRLSNGWELAKISLHTINQNRALLLFPVFSSVSLILVLATFFGGGFFLFGDQIDRLMDDEQSGNILGIAVIFIYYLINFFIIVFFNSALIYCAVKILNGEETSLQEGFDFAFSRIGKIFGWSVLSATVGTLLQLLQNMGKVGEIVAGLIGLAWSVMTFFVVPVLIYEDKGVFESVKESGRLMKQKWGESLAANASFGIFHLLGIIVAVVLGILLMKVSVILAITIAVGIILLVSTVMSAARTVFVAAVYNHVSGRPTGEFDGRTLDSAFIQK
ncbi:MAG: DUF6159 family protein [Thermoanaerobaculia bacterium]|nr:DUF6159 family protein [Thermoanaerobaculia bacterium]